MRLAIDVQSIPAAGPRVGHLDDLFCAMNRCKPQQHTPLHQVPIVTVPLISPVSPVRITRRLSGGGARLDFDAVVMTPAGPIGRWTALSSARRTVSPIIASAAVHTPTTSQ